MNDVISTMGSTELIMIIDTTNSSQYPDIELMPVWIFHLTMAKAPNGKRKLYNMFGLSPETADLYTQLDDLTDTRYIIYRLMSSIPDFNFYFYFQKKLLKYTSKILSLLIN